MSADSMQTGRPEAHGAQDAAPAELGERWRRTVVLKRDIFSIVERGTYRGPDGDVDAVLRGSTRCPGGPFSSRAISLSAKRGRSRSSGRWHRAAALLRGKAGAGAALD
jgi:hypothetical protein